MNASPLGQLDPWPILAALGVDDARNPTPVAGGSDTAIWRVERGGSLYALRLFRSNQHDTCRRERLAMAAAEGTVPVPRIHTHGIWEGRPALLLSWCSGSPLAHLLLQEPRQLVRLGARFGQMHARVHAIAAPVGLSDDPLQWIEWAGPIEAHVKARLRDAAGAGVLLHLDYHPMNVMGDDRRITAVLDWANAHGGDRRADLARTVALFRLAPYGLRPAWRVALYRRLLEASWRAGYSRVAGYPSDMALFYAWAGVSMLHDYAPRETRPDTPYTPAVMARIRRWTNGQLRRAGIHSY